MRQLHQFPEVSVRVLLGLNFSGLPRYYLSKAYNCENHALKIREESVNVFYDKTSCRCAKSVVKSSSSMGGVEILSLLSLCKLRECISICLHKYDVTT